MKFDIKFDDGTIQTVWVPETAVADVCCKEYRQKYEAAEKARKEAVDALDAIRIKFYQMEQAQQHQTARVNESPSTVLQVEKDLAYYNRIQSIRALRARTGMSLVGAKNMIDQVVPYRYGIDSDPVTWAKHSGFNEANAVWREKFDTINNRLHIWETSSRAWEKKYWETARKLDNTEDALTRAINSLRSPYVA